MTLAESAHNGNDVTVELDGLSLVYDTGIKGHLKGKVVDYRTGPAGEGFTITDEGPATRTCGDCSC